MFASLLTALAASAAPVTADSWGPYSDRRVADPTGTYYVVLDAHDPPGWRGVDFTWVRRAAGAPPARSEQAPNPYESRGKPELESLAAAVTAIPEGDVVLARGTLEQTPMHLYVSSEGHGFVAVEKYANLGYGHSVVVVDRLAKQRVLELKDLFPPEEIEAFLHTVSSIWWYEGGWIDEEGPRMVLLGGDQVLRVDWDSGEVEEGGAEDVLRALESRDEPAIALALDRVAASPDLAQQAAGQLRVLQGDRQRPMAVRLRAAVALAARGDLRGLDLVRGATADPRPDGVSEKDRAYALEHLPVFLGPDALQGLRDSMRGVADDRWHAAQQGFVQLGERAVPTLLEMLADEGTADYRGGAAHALGKIGSKAALPGLLTAVEDPVESVANAALNAAIRIGGDSLAEPLAEVLTRESTQVGRLAMYFKTVRHPAVIPVLERRLETAEAGSSDQRRLREALEFQQS